MPIFAIALCTNVIFNSLIERRAFAESTSEGEDLCKGKRSCCLLAKWFVSITSRREDEQASPLRLLLAASEMKM